MNFNTIKITGRQEDVARFAADAEGTSDERETLLSMESVLPDITPRRLWLVARWTCPGYIEYHFATRGDFADYFSYYASIEYPDLCFEATTIAIDECENMPVRRIDEVLRAETTVFRRYMERQYELRDVCDEAAATIIATTDSETLRTSALTERDARECLDFALAVENEEDAAEDERAERLAMGDPDWLQWKSNEHVVSASGDTQEVAEFRGIMEAFAGRRITGARTDLIPVWREQLANPFKDDQVVDEEDPCWVSYKWRSGPSIDEEAMAEISRRLQSLVIVHWNRADSVFVSQDHAVRRVWRAGTVMTPHFECDEPFGGWGLEALVGHRIEQMKAESGRL